MDQKGITPIEEAEPQGDGNNDRNNDPTDEQSPQPDNDQINTQSPEPESGIGKDVESLDNMDPDGDLGKGELDKPKLTEDINVMDDGPSENSSGMELDGDGATQYVSVEKAKPKSNPKFNNSVEPIEYEIAVPRRAPRRGPGGHIGRGPRRAVAVIIIISVIAVALVVGLVLAADLPPPPEKALLYGLLETSNKPYSPAYNGSTVAYYQLVSEFDIAMDDIFVNSSFKKAYNHTEVRDISKNMNNNFLTIDFMLGLTFLFDNSTGDDMFEPVTGNLSALPVPTTTTASMETTTTMILPIVDDDIPLWVAKIIYFIYVETAMGKLGDFTGTMTLSLKDPDSITTSTMSTTSTKVPSTT